MKRQIYLPELLSINIKNYTLYPNGLDYTFDFVKGVNLVLGGNGMGKTTFVNIIKFGIIGMFWKATDLTRTYKDRAIIKRRLYPSDFFSARKDTSTITVDEAIVKLVFRIHDSTFEVTRSLDTGCLLSVNVEGIPVIGEIISEDRYERLDGDIQKQPFLLKKYEDLVLTKSNLSFDDLIFFVNEILFFGEDHKTVLWNRSVDGRADVQNELFNKYFNEPELDLQRIEALRQAKYFDSLSRHKSEDMRVIMNLLRKIKTDGASGEPSHSVLPSALDIMELKGKLDGIIATLAQIQSRRDGLTKDMEVQQGEINRLSLLAANLDEEKKAVEKEMNTALWEKMHPLYDVFVKNIQYNHICPICNRYDNQLAERVGKFPTKCFVCGNEIRRDCNPILMEKYREISTRHRSLYQSISNGQHRIKVIEEELTNLDREFRENDLQRRAILQSIREQEYLRSQSTEIDKLQTLEDEYDRYSKAKEEYQQRSAKYAEEAKKLTEAIESEILNNVSRFSAIFASYAENFLGVKCYLEYTSYDDETKRFYPVIDGKPRRLEESLSESQRFFVDHSFRMSILTFFYSTPSFYIVETPDSSLDLSYEKNAANVFLRFLQKPNSVIVTSNLNNSSFVNHLIENKDIPFALVGLPDIAKTSVVQGTSEQLLSLYASIKNSI